MDRRQFRPPPGTRHNICGTSDYAKSRHRHGKTPPWEKPLKKARKNIMKFKKLLVAPSDNMDRVPYHDEVQAVAKSSQPKPPSGRTPACSPDERPKAHQAGPRLTEKDVPIETPATSSSPGTSSLPKPPISTEPSPAIVSLTKLFGGLTVLSHASNCSQRGGRPSQHGGAAASGFGGSSASGSSSRTPGRGLSSGKPQLGPSGGQNEDGDGDDEGDEGDDDAKRSENSNSLSSGERKFACHYFKHSPGKHKQCWGTGWNIHRLKEHLYRVHELKNSCPRCCQHFKTEGLLHEHVSNREACTPGTRDPSDGFTQAEKEKIKSRVRPRASAGKTVDETKWENIYGILFPLVSKEDYPSPYYEDADLKRAGNLDRVDLSHYVRDLPSMLRRQLEQGFGYLDDTTRQSVIQEVDDSLRTVLHTFPPVAGMCTSFSQPAGPAALQYAGPAITLTSVGSSGDPDAAMTHEEATRNIYPPPSSPMEDAFGSRDYESRGPLVLNVGSHLEQNPALPVNMNSDLPGNGVHRPDRLVVGRLDHHYGQQQGTFDIGEYVNLTSSEASLMPYSVDPDSGYRTFGQQAEENGSSSVADDQSCGGSWWGSAC